MQKRTFLVYADCNSLKTSRTKLDKTPRVHRWWAFLQAFDFEIEYRKGERMAHVDFLSRNPVLEQHKSLNKIPELQINLTEVSDNTLVSEQQRDTEIQEIILKLKNNELPGNLVKTYELRKGMLHRKIRWPS